MEAGCHTKRHEVDSPYAVADYMVQEGLDRSAI